MRSVTCYKKDNHSFVAVIRLGCYSSAHLSDAMARQAAYNALTKVDIENISRTLRQNRCCVFNGDVFPQNLFITNCNAMYWESQNRMSGDPSVIKPKLSVIQSDLYNSP